MSEVIKNGEIDVAAFTNKVVAAVELISSAEELEQKITGQPDQEIKAYSSGFEGSREEAREAVKREDVRRYICPALKTCSNETIEVAKTITPVLVGAVLAGVITIPLNPIFFGWLALVAVKAGVSTICYGIE